jgi:hypothetical protein
MRVLSSAGKNTSSIDIAFAKADVVIIVDGTFDGESVFIERKRDDGSYNPLADGELTSSNEKLVRLWRGAVIRLRTSNGAGAPSIDAYVMQRDA